MKGYVTDWAIQNPMAEPVFRSGAFSRRDVESLSAELNRRAGKVGIAVGDNYLSIRPLIGGVATTDGGRVGIGMYDGITGSPLTGYEKKGRGNGDMPEQPSIIYFNRELKEPHASGLPPQEFPNRMSEGILDMVMNAGYDIMVNSAGIEVHLNGDMNDPVKRSAHMLEDLMEAGYMGVSIGVKPVAFPLIASRRPATYRGPRIKTYSDLQSTRDLDAISEVGSILEQYGRRKNIRFRNIRQAFGGADRQVASGLFPVGSDLLETGNSMLKYAEWIVPIVDDNDRLCIVTYSEPFLLATERAYKNDKAFYDDLFWFVKAAVNESRKSEPDIFAEKYADFLERFRQREAELMASGMLTKEEAAGA